MKSSYRASASYFDQTGVVPGTRLQRINLRLTNTTKIGKYIEITPSVGYTNKANRISLGYGRQRAGIFCVGGVCRTVPASNGLSISITSSF